MNMKKILLTSLFIVAVTFATAQTDVPTKKYSVETNGFMSNWFVTAGIDGTVFYSSQEKGLGLGKSPFHGFRNALGFGVGVGKWFSPDLGVRLKFQGVNGKGVVSEDCSINKSFMKNYWVTNGQMLFNISNIICGYNENRLWNVIVYPGAGLLRNMSKDIYAINVQLGLMNTFRINKNLDLFADVNVIMAEPKADGVNMGSSNNRALFQNYDKILSAEIGVKYNFCKSTWKKSSDVDAINARNAEQVAALNASLKAAQDENSRLKATLAKQNSDMQRLQSELNSSRNQAKPTAPVSTNDFESCVFFARGKSVITNAQKANVERVANYMKKNTGVNILVKGYASPEGPAGLNKRLSEARANAVKTMLVKKYGISASRITTEGCGVGDIFSQQTWNRVAISTVSK